MASITATSAGLAGSSAPISSNTAGSPSIVGESWDINVQRFRIPDSSHVTDRGYVSKIAWSHHKDIMETTRVQAWAAGAARVVVESAQLELYPLESSHTVNVEMLTTWIGAADKCPDEDSMLATPWCERAVSIAGHPGLPWGPVVMPLPLGQYGVQSQLVPRPLYGVYPKVGARVKFFSHRYKSFKYDKETGEAIVQERDDIPAKASLARLELVVVLRRSA